MTIPPATAGHWQGGMSSLGRGNWRGSLLILQEDHSPGSFQQIDMDKVADLLKKLALEGDSHRVRSDEGGFEPIY